MESLITTGTASDDGKAHCKPKEIYMSVPKATEQDITAPVTLDPDETLDLQDSDQEERPPSPVFSCMSMKTDHSRDIPLHFKQEALTDLKVQQERAYSPVPSCLSSRSDLSMDPPETVQEEVSFGAPCTRPGEVACDFCLEKTERAVKSCLTCDASYCETHIRRHYTVPVLQKHKLVDTCGDLEEINRQQNVEDWIAKALPPPENIEFCSVGADFVILSWDVPEGLAERIKDFIVTWHDGRSQKTLKIKSIRKIKIKNLHPGNKYVFKVASVGDGDRQSACVSASVQTDVPAPQLFLEELHPRSFTIKWNKPNLLEQIPHNYFISSTCPETEPVYTTDLKMTFSDLEPDTSYTVEVATILENGAQSQPTSEDIRTKILEELVSHLGMMDYLKGKKLSLTTILEINEKNISRTEESIQSLSSVCWWFLQKLFRVNVMARDVSCTDDTAMKGHSTQDFDQDCNEWESETSDNNINPLDLIAALFLCSDGLLQQEMALKMSLCQFSIPLLLPNCDTQQCTLMLWALRDIVKSYRPHSLLESRGFEENSIVLMDLPMISFVRLGRISLSKSHIVNQVFSNPQQYHDTFVHHNMKNGNISRKVSNGMVEISWYLPGGNRDIFTEPLAVANLRGDISCHQTDFKFLCQTSAAVFVFIDDFKENINLLKPQDSKAPLFLVCNSEKININKNDFIKHIHDLKFNNQFIVMKGRQMNDAQFVEKLRSTIRQSVSSDCAKMSIEKMSAAARELRILVDEDNDLCQKAKQKADAVTASISDIPKYKQDQLPLQGIILKKLAKLEKEECRLKNVGTQNIQMYRSELNNEKQELRKQQVTKDITPAVKNFISGLLVCKEERAYFLKWMRINLDNLSRKYLLNLKQDYKKACENNVENKERILDLENQMSCSSLGIEHFLRELGQFYESANSIPEHSHSKQKMELIKDLPKVCAEMMLEGFPLELVDGDASYIPLKWVSAVLNELHSMEQNLKIRVISVVGVQSTGKSTLLNTMFGVHFVVSSGRCTRGAFMLLIRVNENFREQLGCDFIMVIDTERLRAAELAQLADSYEHDNELATLVVGLSDLTIINIPMENCAEMQDILQIVIHAFLRMKDIGKKTHCQFVHQNVADVTAHDKNMRDRKILLDQLSTITQTAAKMEKGEEKKFTDIIEYSDRDNFYIPSLWQGTPPMAPVNAGYSESVVQVKKRIIDTMIDLKGKRPSQTVEKFHEWTSSLWQAVKYENFIFSFRNNIVAEAYSKLCEQYNTWDSDFQRKMCEWMVQTEKLVFFCGKRTQNPQPTDSAESIENFLVKQKTEAIKELVKAEQQLNDNLTKYFEKPEKHVYLVERYKQDFLNSIKNLRKETENKMMRRLEELRITKEE